MSNSNKPRSDNFVSYQSKNEISWHKSQGQEHRQFIKRGEMSTPARRRNQTWVGMVTSKQPYQLS
jgi:hypothetical protein